MKVLGKIARSIPGFRQLSSNSMIIAAAYYIVAILILVQYWYWGLALLAAPFLLFYLLDLNDKKRRRLSLTISIIAGVLVLVGAAGGLGARGGSEGTVLRQPAPTAKVVATRAPKESSAAPSASGMTAAAAASATSAASAAGAAATSVSTAAAATPQGQYAYVAAKGGKTFHLPGCSSAKRIKSENLIGFQTREEAIAAGLTPCKRCKP